MLAALARPRIGTPTPTSSFHRRFHPFPPNRIRSSPRRPAPRSPCPRFRNPVQVAGL